MKHLLIILLLSLSIPSFAVCPIESGESVCSVPEVKQPFNSMFMDKNNTTVSPNNEKLQPRSKENPIDNMRGQNNTLNNNSVCAFGNCLNDTTQNKRFRESNP